MQDYKSQYAVATISANLVNIHSKTNRQHFDQLI